MDFATPRSTYMIHILASFEGNNILEIMCAAHFLIVAPVSQSPAQLLPIFNFGQIQRSASFPVLSAAHFLILH